MSAEALALETQRVPVRRKAPAPLPPPDILQGRTHRLIHASCVHPKKGMAQLPDRSVGHAISDFPFSAYVHANTRPTVDGDSLAEKQSIKFKPLSPALRLKAMREFKRVVCGWTVIFSDTESSHLWLEAAARVELEYVRTIPWLHRGGTPQKTGDRPAQCHEDVLFFHGGGRKFWYGDFGPMPYDYAVERGTTAQPRLNDAQKPLALMRRIVEDTSQPGETIIDATAGSCTTLVAAVQSGRYGVGWEIDSAQFKSGLARLGYVREQLPLFEAPLSVESGAGG